MFLEAIATDLLVVGPHNSSPPLGGGGGDVRVYQPEVRQEEYINNLRKKLFLFNNCNFNYAIFTYILRESLITEELDEALKNV